MNKAFSPMSVETGGEIEILIHRPVSKEPSPVLYYTLLYLSAFLLFATSLLLFLGVLSSS